MVHRAPDRQTAVSGQFWRGKWPSGPAGWPRMTADWHEKAKAPLAWPLRCPGRSELLIQNLTMKERIMNFSNIKKGASTVAAFIGVVAVKATMFGAGYGAVHAVNYATQPSIHDQLTDVVAKDNAKMPIMINEVTTVTGERVDDGDRLVYVYELKENGAPPEPKEAADRVCTSSALRPLIDYGVKLGYEYHQSGKIVARISLGQSSCAGVPEPANATGSVGVVLDGNRALVPLTVGSQPIWATVDTGCTNMTVTMPIAQKLVSAGEATWLNDGDVSLADGSTKSMPHIRIATLKLGDHTVTDVEAMVVNDGTMMLVGYDVLRKPTGKFAINTTQSTLDF
jgi:gag-polyprotein putative aspartyl protease